MGDRMDRDGMEGGVRSTNLMSSAINRGLFERQEGPL